MKELKFPYSGETVTINTEQKLFKQPDTNKVAVHPYGAIIGKIGEDFSDEVLAVNIDGDEYTTNLGDLMLAEAGASIEFNKSGSDNPAYVGTAIVDTSTLVAGLN